MANFSLIFRLLCLVCCFIALTSYKINRRPSLANRHKRAVTEWRFRRSRLQPYSFYLRNHVLAHNWANYNDDDDSQSIEQRMDAVEPNLYESKPRKH
ncbi:unnamed protein product [Adineta ricciae]|uniref:Uncharacterized protein n=1 Tax=Adineta ricciae TaxID=249248 RepID=A0A814QKT7_ADIRI|nr:unnamed protein product [Adineta ricciae]CAF1123532.1 unnamed protein product [Adineta ricciae]